MRSLKSLSDFSSNFPNLFCGILKTSPSTRTPFPDFNSFACLRNLIFSSTDHVLRFSSVNLSSLFSCMSKSFLDIFTDLSFGFSPSLHLFFTSDSIASSISFITFAASLCGAFFPVDFEDFICASAKESFDSLIKSNADLGSRFSNALTASVLGVLDSISILSRFFLFPNTFDLSSPSLLNLLPLPFSYMLSISTTFGMSRTLPSI